MAASAPAAEVEETTTASGALQRLLSPHLVVEVLVPLLPLLQHLLLQHLVLQHLLLQHLLLLLKSSAQACELRLLLAHVDSGSLIGTCQLHLLSCLVYLHRMCQQVLWSQSRFDIIEDPGVTLALDLDALRLQTCDLEALVVASVANQGLARWAYGMGHVCLKSPNMFQGDTHGDGRQHEKVHPPRLNR